MARAYRLTPGRRIANSLIKAALSVGLGPPRTYMLAVPGRRSGRLYQTPVRLVLRDGQRYLVSAYGERSWTKNARAAGEVTLRRGRRADVYALEPVEGLQAGHVLHQYVLENPLVHRFFEAGRNATPEQYAAEAAEHPVFLLRPQQRFRA